MNPFLELELGRSKTSAEAMKAMAEDQAAAGAILAAVETASPASRVSGYTLDDHGRLSMTIILNPARFSGDSESSGAAKAQERPLAISIPGTPSEGESPTREEPEAMEADVERMAKATVSESIPKAKARYAESRLALESAILSEADKAIALLKEHGFRSSLEVNPEKPEGVRIRLEF